MDVLPGPSTEGCADCTHDPTTLLGCSCHCRFGLWFGLGFGLLAQMLGPCGRLVVGRLLVGRFLLEFGQVHDLCFRRFRLFGRF